MKKQINAYLMLGKKLSLITLILILSTNFSSCDPVSQEKEEEIERLEREKEALLEIISSNEENVQKYFTDLNQIEENLRVIKQKENLISQQAIGDIELGNNQQDRINADIKTIADLMEKNRNLIANLNNRLRNANTRIKGFEESIERLNKTINEKEIEIELLRNQLASTNLRVDLLTAKLDTLEKENYEKNIRIDQQVAELNTAWYCMGSRKELTDNSILARDGGFLGLGKSDRLRSDFNRNYFTRIDLTRDTQITIAGLNPELITPHPAGSYKIVSENGETFLEILKPENFWAATKYLVIQVR
jgi:predicted  nucleic acid-binding Zn-ribbon protein